jgi:glycosyltransferase involved in cell wall biosynthesis
VRILFVDSGDAESVATWSGTTNSILEQLRLKHDVVLLHKLNKWMKYVYAPYVLQCKIRGLKFQIDRHAMVARNYASQVEEAYKYCKPDIVFSVSAIPLAHLPADIPCAMWTDAVMQDMIDFYWPSTAYHWRSLDAGKRLDKLALRKNFASIFSSKWAADGARKVAPESSNRIHIVPFGANSVANPPPQGPRALPGDSAAPINFLFVGVDWKRKGGQDSVDALRILRSKGHNVRLSIVGARPLSDGVDSEFVRQFGFLDRHIDDEGKLLLRLYKDAHFFILPTHAECAGIALAEAASFGLPIISRNVGGVISTVERNVNSILIEREEGPEVLAQSIRPLLFDKDRYRAMSEASLHLFADRLNWKTAVAKVTDILEKATR